MEIQNLISFERVTPKEKNLPIGWLVLRSTLSLTLRLIPMLPFVPMWTVLKFVRRSKQLMILPSSNILSFTAMNFAGSFLSCLKLPFLLTESQFDCLIISKNTMSVVGWYLKNAACPEFEPFGLNMLIIVLFFLLFLFSYLVADCAKIRKHSLKIRRNFE